MRVDGCPTSPGGVGGAGNKFSQARVVPNALSTKSGFCWFFLGRMVVKPWDRKSTWSAEKLDLEGLEKVEPQTQTEVGEPHAHPPKWKSALLT